MSGLAVAPREMAAGPFARPVAASTCLRVTLVGARPWRLTATVAGSPGPPTEVEEFTCRFTTSTATTPSGRPALGLIDAADDVGQAVGVGAAVEDLQVGLAVLPAAVAVVAHRVRLVGRVRHQIRDVLGRLAGVDVGGGGPHQLDGRVDRPHP